MTETSPIAPDVEFDDPLSELEDRRSSPPSYEIATYPADFTLEVLHSKWQAGEIRIPRFQRGFVWNQNQASKLIESFLVGLPVPSIFLYTERDTEEMLVVDGQQRLRSVFFYFTGFFGEEDRTAKRSVFRLRGLSEDSPFHNKTFEDLKQENSPAALKLKNSVLRAFVIRQLNPADDTSIFHVFERLNTGGTLLHNQEVRNAVCGGPLNDLLHSLNGNAQWRKILGKPTPDSRMRDVELILRFFALHHAADRYAKPMKDFMSHYMRTHALEGEEGVQRLRYEFEETTRVVFEHFGDRPFHLFAGFNSSVFDSVYCAIADNLDGVPDDLLQRWETLRVSPAFEALVRGGTTDLDQVKGRLGFATEALFR